MYIIFNYILYQGEHIFFGMKNKADQSFSLLKHIFIEFPVLKLVSIMMIM